MELRELDGLVAEAMGHKRCPGEEFDHFVDDDNILYLCDHFSTDWTAAGKAWEWLSGQIWHGDNYAVLGQSINDKPAVLILGKMENPRWPHIRWQIEGETYPHAIALGILEVSRIKNGK